MTRSQLPSLLLVWLVLATALQPGCGAPPPPNVLLVTIDTLRADRLGIYGGDPEVTPHLDALAAQGVVFERALAASSRTAPSHASLFTSRWVRDHAVGHNNGGTRLDDEPTLAALFAREGYATAAFVSNTMLQPRIGLDRGFSVYDATLPDREANRLVFERIAPKTTRAALDWLAAHDGGPFLLWVQYNDPHGPYTPPDAHRRAPGIPEDEAPLPALRIQRGYGGIPAYQVQGALRQPSAYRALYAGEIRFVDEWLGRLVDAVDARAGAHRTLVVVVADHGETLGAEDLWFSHGYTTAPDVAHVPWLIRGPGIEPGRVRGPVHHVDLLPTLLDLAGLPPLPDAAGISLAPVLRGESGVPTRTLYVDVGREVAAYRGDAFVRVRPGDDGGEASRSYRWNDDGTWQPRDTPLRLEEAVRAYDADRAPLRVARPLEPSDVERLRALGYIEPGADTIDED